MLREPITSADEREAGGHFIEKCVDIRDKDIDHVVAGWVCAEVSEWGTVGRIVGDECSIGHVAGDEGPIGRVAGDDEGTTGTAEDRLTWSVDHRHGSIYVQSSIS